MEDSNSMSYPSKNVLGHKSMDINPLSYSFGAIKLKSIALPTLRLNLKPSNNCNFITFGNH